MMSDNRTVLFIDSAMSRAVARPLRLPMVAWICAGVFLLYLLLATGQQVIQCDRTPTGDRQCQSRQSLLLGQITWFSQRFELKGIDLESDLCDNTPRGGVRFCHHLTLVAEDRSYPLPMFRSPLSSATIRESFDRLQAGDYPQGLTFQATRRSLVAWRIDLMALLLMIVAWGFWDWGLPPAVEPLLPVDQPEADEDSSLV